MAYTCFGIKAKNNDQKEAIHALLDPTVDLVILQGVAGSGKTLLAIAAGLEQVIKAPRYTEIIFTRATVGIGNDIGSLPGTEEEKILPFAAGLIDNLEILSHSKEDSVAAKGQAFVMRSKIKIKALQFMRGRSFVDKWVIIDEVQNITPKQLKVLITRAGENCKIICLGDVNQIDDKNLNSENNAMTYLINRSQDVDFVRYVELTACERSKLAAWAAETL